MSDSLHPVRSRRVLPNGLTVLVLERRHLPIVSATLLVPAGVAAEPESDPGVAHFVSQLLPLGTSRRGAIELAEAVDGIGATLSTSCDFDYATVDLTGRAADARVLMETLSEVALGPAFQGEEIERKRSQILGYLEGRKDDHSSFVRERFFEAIYGAHPYHRTKEGTPESVGRMDWEAIVAFHGGRYVPVGSILALVGDIDADTALAWAEERFGTWATTASPKHAIPPMPTPTERAVVTIQQEVTQATIRMGNIGLPRNHPDHNAAVVMNYILGGSGFGSRLMKNLREERGLTYGVHSNFWPRREPGYFFAATQTKVESMNEAIHEMLAEVERFRDEGVTDEELAWAKKYFTGSLPLTMETNDQIAAKLIEQEFYGLPDEFWLRDLTEMQAVTREQILDVARRSVHPEHFAIVVLADFREHPLEVK
jgi:zinc protease